MVLGHGVMRMRQRRGVGGCGGRLRGTPKMRVLVDYIDGCQARVAQLDPRGRVWRAVRTSEPAYVFRRYLPIISKRGVSGIS